MARSNRIQVKVLPTVQAVRRLVLLAVICGALAGAASATVVSFVVQR